MTETLSLSDHKKVFDLLARLSGSFLGKVQVYIVFGSAALH